MIRVTLFILWLLSILFGVTMYALGVDSANTNTHHKNNPKIHCCKQSMEHNTSIFHRVKCPQLPKDTKVKNE